MVCGDAVLLDFWCGFAEIFILFLFLFAVLQFYETKQFAVFRIQCGLRFGTLQDITGQNNCDTQRPKLISCDLPMNGLTVCYVYF